MARRRHCLLVVGILLATGGCKLPNAETNLHSTAAVNVYATPVRVGTSLRFVDLTAGYSHMCGVTTSRTAACWGSNEYQQLGTTAPLVQCDHAATACSPSPMPVSTSVGFNRLGASLRNSCGVSLDGAAWCWGYGAGGALGNGQSSSSEIPVPVAIAGPVDDIALGGSGLIVCALGVDGHAYCWGAGGGGGGLGDGTTSGSNAPVTVAGGLTFTALAVGDEHACGLATDATAYCWGHDLYGALGAGVPGAHSTPVAVDGGIHFVALSAGLAHTCGVASGGRAYCWGFPPSVGVPDSRQAVLSPVAVAGDHLFTQISAGGNATCALDAAGHAWCWGQNGTGILGDGSQIDRVAPVPVAGNRSFSIIRVGGMQACGLDGQGIAYCWGLNTFGSVGQAPVAGS